MIFTKRITLLIAILGLTCVSVAQQPSPSNSKAKSQLDKAVKLLENNAYKGNFSLTYSNGQTSKKEVQKGSFSIYKTRFAFILPQVESYFDGKTQWVYLKESNEVSLSEPTADELKEINPMMLLSTYSKTHRVDFDDQPSNNAAVNQFILIPNDRKQSYFKVKVHTLKTTNLVTEIQVFQKNGDKLLFVPSAFQKIDSPTNMLFVFPKEKHPKVMINDLR